VKTGRLDPPYDRTMKKLGVLLILVCAGLAAAASVARPAATDGTLTASVGPGFSISLTQNGTRVTWLKPGTYTVNVDDKATEHNFHLTGTGVDKSTAVDTLSTATWTVTFTDGKYFYLCDAHPSTMLGNFTVSETPPVTTTVPASLSLRTTAKVTARIVSVHAIANRTAALDFALLRGTTRVAHATARGTSVTVKLKAPKAGRYVARVIAKSGTATVKKSLTVTVH
jgi:plastocyanin